MKLLTKHTDYAVRALLCLAQMPRKTLSSRTIAARERIPLPFMRRILQALKKGDLIEATEGISGGVRLKRAPEKIYLAGLMELFQGRLRFAECLFRKKICRNRPTCPLRKRIRKIETVVANELKRVTLAELA